MSSDIKVEETIRPFTVEETVDGKKIDVSYAVRKPSGQEGIEGSKVYAKAWNEALKSGAPLRAQVEGVLVERGLWSPEKEKELVSQAKALQAEVDKLNKGGMSLEEGRKLGLLIRDLRYDFNRLALEKSVLDNNTVEGQAEIARINYLISVCTVYNYGSKKRVFSSLEDYYNRAHEKVAQDATTAFMGLVYNLNSDYEKEYPENKFLYKYKFINSDLQVLNSDGEPYDPDTGFLIDKNGRWIDKDKDFINKEGEKVNENGELKIEFQPFTDGNGNPVPEPPVDSAE